MLTTPSCVIRADHLETIWDLVKTLITPQGAFPTIVAAFADEDTGHAYMAPHGGVI